MAYEDICRAQRNFFICVGCDRHACERCALTDRSGEWRLIENHQPSGLHCPSCLNAIDGTEQKFSVRNFLSYYE